MEVEILGEVGGEAVERGGMVLEDVGDTKQIYKYKVKQKESLMYLKVVAALHQPQHPVVHP